ncbi:unnamed protein product [Allacma fusca]|uniref:Rho guanine nucleotide exchange factor 12 n=1 Tax=Allacma fusca TaxID=39272 RepID=A0A8J2LGE0_9HEXA|nr:unnamed protein product [Allacma fusca]
MNGNDFFPPFTKPILFSVGMADRPLSSGGAPSSSSLRSNSDRRPDTLSEERLANDGFTYEDEGLDRVQQEPRRSSNAVGRSESCKERVQRKQRERRKHSDPNLTSKSSDVDLDNQRHLSDANNSGSSSNSSLSARSLDSPSTSLELVGPNYLSSSSLPGRNSETPETTVSHSGVLPDSVKPFPGWEEDSDIEIDQDPPDWTKNVPEEKLAALDRLEKKRQEVLNELFHTERSHVRNLKVVDRLFHRPIRQQQLLPPDIINKLFANLEEMLEIHEKFNASLKAKRKENPLVGDIGPVLLEMFDGERGLIFKQTASYFCAKQQIGLELLKDKRRKDAKFNAFLLEAESDQVCRRLQISDMIPMAMQRLTKYPLLYENILNCTPSDTDEYKSLQRAVELSKEILNSVNRAKKDAEDEQRLREIQMRLLVDKSDKSDPCINELKNLDFTKHKLIYEGPLSWRMTKGNKQKSDFYDVQAVLLNDMVVLLLRENDRFVLKMHTLNFAGKVDRVLARPIIKLHNLLHRPAAADKKAFFLLNTTSSNMNMYELWCSTTEERKLWLHHITKAADDYKSRQQESRREINPNANIPPSVPEPDDKPKDGVGEVGEVPVDGSGDTEQQGSGQESSGASPHKDASPAPETSSNLNASPGTDNPASPESTKNAPGGGWLSVMSGDNKGRSNSVSPSPSRRKGGFLRVTESAPLVDPSEVVVATRDVHFAQPVVSQYEELKRVDSTINKLFDEKQKLVSKIMPIPSSGPDECNHVADNSVDSGPAKDAKDLVVACMHQVDQLGRILAGQKIPNDSLPLHREQFAIQKSLSNLLTQLLSEVQRRDEDSELRRQELHRLREQNHGYHERLQSRSKTDRQTSPGQLSSPTLSPSHSRPSSFLSVSSSSDHHDDEPEVVMKTPLKAQLSAPVATCSFNRTSPQPLSRNNSSAADGSSGPLPVDNDGSGFFQAVSACDLAPEEFADAVEEAIVSDVKPLKSEGNESYLPVSATEPRIVTLDMEHKSQPAELATTENEVPEGKRETIVLEDNEKVRTNGHVSCTLAPLASEVITASQKSSDTDVNDFDLTKCSPLGNLEIIGECDEVCGTKFQEEKEHVDALSQN